uniref:Uncharacterized protein n=1 Tax=Arundo donax TaxID=35708 RepID=A0A0A9A7N7_ARUDO
MHISALFRTWNTKFLGDTNASIFKFEVKQQKA